MEFKEIANGGRVVELLRQTGRDGMEDLIKWLYEVSFFTSPASTKYHGAYEGGLVRHSLNVYEQLGMLAVIAKMDVPEESMIIAALLHDVCKAGAYIATPDGANPYRWNKSHPKGHAELSIQRVKQFIELTELEEKMIRFHMGVYGLNEFDERRGEYPLRGGGMANAWHHHPAVKLIYFADELATLSEQRDVASTEGGAE